MELAALVLLAAATEDPPVKLDLGRVDPTVIPADECAMTLPPIGRRQGWIDIKPEQPHPML
jgi:hypothetical protein